MRQMLGQCTPPPCCPQHRRHRGDSVDTRCCKRHANALRWVRVIIRACSGFGKHALTACSECHSQRSGIDVAIWRASERRLTRERKRAILWSPALEHLGGILGWHQCVMSVLSDAGWRRHGQASPMGRPKQACGGAGSAAVAPCRQRPEPMSVRHYMRSPALELDIGQCRWARRATPGLPQIPAPPCRVARLRQQPYDE